MQRLFDILFSGTAIFVLAPLLLTVTILLRFTGEGEILFVQTRVGKAGAKIRILKFATMLKDSPKLGTGTVTLKDDPRVLPVGRVLRKTKINELPQLFNILKGDMSIIGPRPQTPRCFEAFPKRSREVIVSVRPGLSGVGSIFFRNEEFMMHDAANADDMYDNIVMPFKGQLEEWYVQNRSFVLYLLLIISTIFVIISGKIPFLHSIFSSTPRVPDELEPYI